MTPVPSWLPLAVILTLAASSVIRLVGLRQAGVNALALRAGDDAHGFTSRMFTVLVTATLIFCLIYAVRPATNAALGPLAWPGQDIVAWIGAALAVGGTVLAVAAQFGMGRSWRIGFRENDESALVSTGLYRLSRNPIYVGMIGAMIGIFLIVPNAVTLALLIATWVATSVQIKLEEEFLSRRHGAAYETYRAQTRRWL